VCVYVRYDFVLLCVIVNDVLSDSTIPAIEKAMAADPSLELYRFFLVRADCLYSFFAFFNLCVLCATGSFL